MIVFLPVYYLSIPLKILKSVSKQAGGFETPWQILQREYPIYAVRLNH